MLRALGMASAEMNMHRALECTPFRGQREKYPLCLSRLIDYARKVDPAPAPLLVAVSGPRNSSKSGCAQELARLLGTRYRVAVISMDDYIQPPAFFRAWGIDTNLQAKDPLGIDFGRIVRDIDTLASGGSVTIKTRDRYRFNDLGLEQVIDGSGLEILLIEGMSVFVPTNIVLEGRLCNPYIGALARRFALKIYFDITPEDAQKVFLTKAHRRRNLGLPVMPDALQYLRFCRADLPRFDGYYPLCRSNADVVCKLFSFGGRWQLSTLILGEGVLQRGICHES